MSARSTLTGAGLYHIIIENYTSYEYSINVESFGFIFKTYLGFKFQFRHLVSARSTLAGAGTFVTFENRFDHIIIENDTSYELSINIELFSIITETYLSFKSLVKAK